MRSLEKGSVLFDHFNTSTKNADIFLSLRRSVWLSMTQLLA
jgi:hypothetical protein